ncbi:HAD hydrolase family protein [uncultured Desulfosarcina sp.]|uniref:KdsC family phosphatase n=1 Tax=uncultured Desulfosarcina sp. TaxID=218289 RepID=UPI0029C61D4B|nr:HAD hydrolase family protein [uncultured Desulfosarcina sp.]
MDRKKISQKELKQLVDRIKLVAFDFDGVFTDNRVFVFQDGTEAVMCSRSDGIGLCALRKRGIKTVIISTETNPVVTGRSKKLKMPCVQSCDDKLSELKKVAAGYNCSLKETAYVGNDINDLECLREVALPMVTQDAHPDVIAYGKYRTLAKGGHGAVREICDLFCTLLDTAN